MNRSAKTFGTALAAAGAALLLAGVASAQQGQSSATTRSLNAGPAESNLSTRPNAQPPLASAPAVQSIPSRARPVQTQAQDRTLEDLLGDTQEATPRAPATSTGVTLAAGETEPEPIPMTLGYYVRGDKDCDQVWPGEGDLAWLTPTSFTIDYGGCEPGQFLQTSANSWREEQRCVTESGGNAGSYEVTYEVLGADVIRRSARLAIDDTVEQDDWKHCALETVPENARFGT